MSYPTSSAMSHDEFLGALLMNVHNSSGEAAAKGYPQGFAYVPRPFTIQHTDENDDPVKWVADNLSELLSKFADNWVVVKNAHVLVHASNLPELLRLAADAGIKNPFVLKIERPPAKTWRTAFGYTR
jgi:hypothetical protein